MRTTFWDENIYIKTLFFLNSNNYIKLINIIQSLILDFSIIDTEYGLFEIKIERVQIETIYYFKNNIKQDI